MTIIEKTALHSSKSRALLASLMKLPQEHSANGCYIYDDKGEAYLDCGGYGVFICGHRHPKVVKAVKNQIDKMPMSSRTLLSPILAEASEKLANYCPENLEHVFFCNSGAEATELAIKLIRADGRKNIIALEGSYHGKTLGALSVTHRAFFRNPFEPLLDSVDFVPVNDFTALSKVINGWSKPGAIIFEPIQGEAGVIALEVDYLNKVQQLCDETGTALIVDEIQSGLGRTGRRWAHTKSNIKPDIMLVGKGLSGGIVPCAAVVSTAKLHKPIDQDFILHSSTFGGSPIALAAAISVIQVLETEALIEKSYFLGVEIKAKLKKMCEGLNIEIRGEGLLIGIVCDTPQMAGTIMANLLKQKVITCMSLSQSNTVRLTPSAILTVEHLAHLYRAFYNSINIYRENNEKY